MDLLSQRYADPYLILDDFIRLHQLHEFLETIMQSIAEEKVQDIRWEYYLHKVWDISFEEYIATCESKPVKKQDAVLEKEQIVQIVEDSSNILDTFIMEPQNSVGEEGEKIGVI